MDLRQVAKDAPYHLATEIGGCQLWRFWVVLLSNGMEIFQTLEDPSLAECNPWIRLSKFCADHNLKIVSMSFARKDYCEMAQINLKPMADGYFYSRRIRKMLCADPGFSGYQDEAQGFGELNGNILTIHWVRSDEEGAVTVEHRDISKSTKHQSLLGLIRNN